MGVSTRDACIVSHGQRKPDDKNIFVDDLQTTLEAHRAANHAKRIHKVKVAPGTGLGIRNLKLPLSRNTSSSSAQQEIIVGATTSKLAGAEETISKSNTLVHGSIEEECDTDNPSGLPLEHRSPKTQSLDYKGRYRVVQDQWQPRQRSPFRSSRPIRFGYNEAVDSQPQLVIPKATDPPEEHEGERLWMSYIESDESDGTLRLNEEIKAFERFMKPTSDEEKSTQAAISLAQSVVATVAPTSVLTLHGSRYTGVANPLSDIDFSVSLPDYEKDSLSRGPSIHRPEARRAATTLLRKIEKALIKSPRYEHVNFILARVKLVVAVDSNTRLHLQFQTQASFMPAREYSMQYLSEFPSLRPLYVLLRHFLLMRGFTGARDGGVGSYPLLIMIVTAFKHSRQIFAPEDLGIQLLHVLKFWSIADLYMDGYSADPPICFTKTPPKMSLEERNERLTDPILKGIDIIREPNKDMPFLLCLQDPGNPTNDLGKRTTQIKDIQACFTTARENLIHSLRRWEKLVEYNAHEKARRYSFLDSLVGADYSTFHRQRHYLANAHKVEDKIAFRGQKRLDVRALQSLPTIELDPPESPKSGRLVDSQ
ncbi:hypothetical protein MMC15_005059 [Xylographa vitiligo]|nr:hypothetical protein [Xylographa vitiligo]